MFMPIPQAIETTRAITEDSTMDRLLRENGVHIYLLDENQPNDLYKLPKELHIGREHTDKGETGVMLRPIEGVIKLDKVVRNNKIDENLRQLCKDVYWLLAYNLHKDQIFLIAKYK
jgi:hypothetical protein